MLPDESVSSSAFSGSSIDWTVPSDAQRRTIYALATPPGKGGVAVIRISGPDALAVYDRIVRPTSTRKRRRHEVNDNHNFITTKGKMRENDSVTAGNRVDPEPRRMIRCAVVDPISGDELDDGLAVFFKGPHSFTTEDILELHLHSGRAVISAVLSALGRLSSPIPKGHARNSNPDEMLLLRPAERGEFTRRAFQGGRLDLTQAEALRDLIEADTEAQRRVALSSARGSARVRFESMRNEIIKAMAMTEALIDFGEGEDLEEGVFDNAREIVKRLRRTIAHHLADSRRGEILRSGVRLAIFGPPNAGKSSLLNHFAGREAAIVTPIPGTTRDVVELTLDIGGLPVVIADTAGLRKTEDMVERIGVDRAKERVANSDIALCVLSLPDIVTDNAIRLPEYVDEMVAPSTFILLNKRDLCSASDISKAQQALTTTCAGAWAVSLTCGEGVERFVSEFGEAVNDKFVPGDGEEEPLVANARQRAHLEAAQEYLDAFLRTEDVVLAAEELRYAANAVGKVTGVIGVEDVLDVVFREFCIGKGRTPRADRANLTRQPPFDDNELTLVVVLGSQQATSSPTACTRMPKPTLLQNLFNKPTQSYADLQPASQKATGETARRKYHSVRNDMLAAAEASRSRKSIPSVSKASSSSAAAAAPPSPSPSRTTTAAPTTPRRPEHRKQKSDDSDSDQFFTPNGSPRESAIDPDGHISVATNISTTPTMGATLVGQPTLHPAMSAKLDGDNDTFASALAEPNTADSNDEQLRHAHRPMPSSASSSTSSIYTPSLSDASWPTSFSGPSDSTRTDTPATSESGHSRSTSSRRNSRSRRRKDEHRQTMYTDDDWAKDVRWLVAPAPQPAKQQINQQSSIIRSSTPTSTSTKRNRPRPSFELDPSSMLPTLPGAPLQIRAAHRRAVSQTTCSRRNMGRRRMSAVWEEDEGDEPSPNAAPRRVHTDPSILSSLGRSPSLTSQQRLAERARSPTTTRSGESGSIASSAANSAYTNTSRTVDIPFPLPATDGGTPSGFTSLVLPRAAYIPSNKRYSMRFGSSSHVDITRSGLAQTTMSTVSITKNAATSALSGSRPRFLSLSSLSLPTLGSDRKTKLPTMPSHLLGTLPPPLSFTSHTPPPSKVNSHQILVQVYAVAVDGLDDRIVYEKAARNDCYGFVPGRAFVGRAVEVGFEVNSVSKSDSVIGLLDVRKCGALAEFVVVEKRRITRCPRPSASLTLEQLALLPLCGVPAHRAARSAGFSADAEVDSAGGRALVLQGHDGAGALVVQALAAARMHVTAHIPVQADAPRLRTSSSSSTTSSEESDKQEQAEHSSTREAEERVRKWGARGVRIGDAIEVVENCGAGSFNLVVDTVGGRQIWNACQRVLAASGLFTTLVGDASPSPSSSPSSSAHFSPTSKNHSNSTPTAVPSINAHFRANLRSLRRSFGPRKNVGYALISPVADVDNCGEDVRDSLVEAVQRATAGVFLPYVGEGEPSEKQKSSKRRVVPFERAPELFGSGMLSDGRTGVVRIVD
ncbi:uncharacterized protein FOMMEDRAFT_147656 [Fomitiporia mediterranea MF3/22]|uniref:uncharacterized protein n=1 Tax=Fomitiporia mediterranea (strain MF3/22) TaxID=694068 RepID=UPI000440866A|nr:uncharacterized protein FOMMEDRAFT_147656 [Fomitiporia mediterranea MF3/22]EJD00980.1 hypothetical protein FOMMEDRAFT_147656 [Fomitiporia mediterranea MF3/22]